MADVGSTSGGNQRSAQRWTTVLDGHRLRQLRRQHGLSQVELADQAGMSLGTVTRLERQFRASCRCRTLARLAAALGERPATLALPVTLTATPRTDHERRSP
ncbi:MAG TPA: helix-turn-helix transcriptional regulator [Streptosporangiaceae bacterium]|nr:helix-turn-helix transcriptional regulator [Streptosporangiaceae bacterium]